MSYDVAQLHDEIAALGFPVGCVSSSARGDVTPLAGCKFTDEQLKIIEAVKAAHDPSKAARAKALEAALVLDARMLGLERLAALGFPCADEARKKAAADLDAALAAAKG